MPSLVSKKAIYGGYYQQKAPHRRNGRGILVKPSMRMKCKYNKLN
jgi:hypothetical protein